VKGIKYVAPIKDFCYSEDTEVLTDSGWKFFYELSYGDKLATLSRSHTLEYDHPEQIIEMHWEGDLLHFYSSKVGIDLLVSPNHKMYVQSDAGKRAGNSWRFEKAEDVFGKYRLYKKNADSYDKQGPEFIEIIGRKVKTEVWLEFLGYYLSEGSSTITKVDKSKQRYKNYIVQIRQRKDLDNLNQMAIALQRVSSGKINIRPDGRVIVNDKDLCIYLKETFGGFYDKYIPREVLNHCSREQLRILFDALMLGDGKITPEGQSGGDFYSTSSPQLRDDIQELLLKIGYCGDCAKTHSAGQTSVYADGHTATASVDGWKIGIRWQSHEPALSTWSNGSAVHEKVPYNGNIYCATVKNHTMYVRRNGKAVWSGNSGYGEASRNYILALHKAGVPITVEPHCFDNLPPPVAATEEWEILKSLEGKDIDFDIVIVHLTPDLAPRYVAKYKDKYVISYTVWETDKLHPYWVTCLNAVSEVWVPSEWNVETFKRSGVTVPIHKIPHGIDPDTYNGIKGDDFLTGGEDTFNFYSVFQWSARKNPEGLLRAYFNAFQNQDDVRLILKTYMGGGLTPHDDAQRIKDRILWVKSDMHLQNFPRVTLISDKLSAEHMRSLHLFGNAYVSLPHGEGFGLGFLEAGLVGNPVIGTNGGGHLEFMNHENSYLVGAYPTFVSGMGSFNPWYVGDQKWYEPDLVDAVDKLRFVKENFSVAQTKGARLKGNIVRALSWEQVAQKIIARLKEVA